jgi:hypothetical protein
MSVTPRRLSCLYYPYSRTASLTTLKKAVLLFDDITFLDSQPWFVRRHLTADRPPALRPATDDDYAYLEAHGFIRILSPEDLIQEFDLILTATVRDDLRDAEFCELAVRNEVSVWDVLTERIPPSFLQAFRSGVGRFSEAISLQALINAEGSLEKLEGRIRRIAEFRWKGLQPDQLWPTFLDRYRFVIGGNPHIRLESYKITFLQASSLRINEALVVGARNNLVPFTDSVIHDRMMNIKVSRCLKNLATDAKLRDYLELTLPAALPYEHLAIRVLDRLVAEEEINNRSLRELFEYRQDNRERLNRMRLALGILAAEIQATTLDGEYYRSISAAIESKVVPEVLATRNELLKRYEGAFGRLAIQSTKVTVPTLVATILGGLGLWQIIGACALAELTFLSAKGADHLLDLWRAKRVADRGAYSYLTAIGA